MLADVAERWVAEIVGEAGSLDDLGIEASRVRLGLLLLAKHLSQTAPDLRHLYRVLLTCVKDVCLARTDYLRNTSQPMECRGIENTITVPLESGPLVTTAAFVSPDLAVL